MTVVSKTTLKTYFETGDKPTQSQFEDLIDSLAGLDTSSLASTTQAGPVRIATSAEVVEASAVNLAISPGTLNAREATTAQRGLIEIATTAEVNTGTSEVLALTTSNINGRIATTARAGLIEIATTAETQAGASETLAVTPSTLRSFSLNTGLARGYIDGLLIENASADTVHDITFRQGVAKDDPNTLDLSLQSNLTKQWDATWVSGNNQGGRPNNLPVSANNTTIHAFIISQPGGSPVDAGFDTNVSANNLLAQASAYTTYRRVASFRTDASAAIIQFKQDGDRFVLERPVLDVNTLTYNTSANIRQLSVPITIRPLALVQAAPVQVATNPTYGLLTNPEQIDVAPSAAVFNIQSDGDGARATRTQNYNDPIQVDTSAQIRIRWSANSGGSLDVMTLGWVDQRGKNKP